MLPTCLPVFVCNVTRPAHFRVWRNICHVMPLASRHVGRRLYFCVHSWRDQLCARLCFPAPVPHPSRDRVSHHADCHTWPNVSSCSRLWKMSSSTWQSHNRGEECTPLLKGSYGPVTVSLVNVGSVAVVVSVERTTLGGNTFSPNPQKLCIGLELRKATDLHREKAGWSPVVALGHIIFEGSGCLRALQKFTFKKGSPVC